jgi:hypothetical protein
MSSNFSPLVPYRHIFSRIIQSDVIKKYYRVYSDVSYLDRPLYFTNFATKAGQYCVVDSPQYLRKVSSWLERPI